MPVMPSTVASGRSSARFKQRFVAIEHLVELVVEPDVETLQPHAVSAGVLDVRSCAPDGL